MGAIERDKLDEILKILNKQDENFQSYINSQMKQTLLLKTYC